MSFPAIDSDKILIFVKKKDKVLKDALVGFLFLVLVVALAGTGN